MTDYLNNPTRSLENLRDGLIAAIERHGARLRDSQDARISAYYEDRLAKSRAALGAIEAEIRAREISFAG